MRHQKKGFKLNRTNSHRKATMAAMSMALIKHKRITTTVTKAKALRVYIEPLVSRAKVDSTHNRREVFKVLQDKHAIKELFGEVATKVGDRPGGYTRVIRLGQRSGDSAPMAMIEFVDYNDVRPAGGGTTKKKTRRGRRTSSGKSSKATAAASATVATDVAEDVDVEDADPQVDEVEASAVEEVDVETDETAVDADGPTSEEPEDEEEVEDKDKDDS